MEKLDRRQRPAVSSFSFREMPPCHVSTLDNGVRLHIIDNGTMPVNRVTIVAGYGAENGEKATDVSAAHLLLPLFAEGTTDKSGAEIAHIIDYEGAMIETPVTELFTCLSLTSLNCATPRLTPLLTDIFRNATIPDEAFRAVRSRSAQRYEIQCGNPATVATRGMVPLVYGPHHPLRHRIDSETIMATEVDMVRHVHASARDKATIDIFAGGKMDKSTVDAITALGLSLRDKKLDSPLPLAVHPFKFAEAQRIAIAMPESLQTAISISIPAIPRSHPDYNNLRLTVMALGGYFGSRLMTNIREEKGLTYGIGASLLGNLDGAYVTISAQCRAGSADTVISEIGNEINTLATEPMGADELSRLRQYAFTQLMSTLDSPFSITDYYRNMLMLGIPEDYFRQQFEAITTLTPQTIMEIAGRYLAPEGMRIVTAG